MKNLLDLTGLKVGFLTVIKFHGNLRKNNQYRRMWLCQCECGNKTIVDLGSLRKSSIKNCGCSLRYSSLEEAIKLNTKWNGDCLEWIGCLSRGYGVFEHLGKRYLSHRVSYDLSKKIINEKSFICHSCNNRCCCNPDHLYEGDAKTNATDRINCGSTPKGSKCVTSKLCESQILKIRSQHPKLSYRQLSIKYKICKTTIANIITKKTWRHI